LGWRKSSWGRPVTGSEGSGYQRVPQLPKAIATGLPKRR
jgi:hypothetical protein